jgi:hypothetical protein
MVLEDHHTRGLRARYREEATATSEDFLSHLPILDNQTVNRGVKLGGSKFGFTPCFTKSNSINKFPTCNLINELFHFLYFLSSF